MLQQIFRSHVRNGCAGQLWCALGVLLLAGCSQRAPDEIVSRHIEAFTRHDWDAVLEDYAEDIVFLGPTAPVVGKAELRTFMQSLQGMEFTETAVPAAGDIGALDWVLNPGKPGAMQGRDIFVIRGGKIVFQGTVSVRPVSSAQ